MYLMTVIEETCKMCKCVHVIYCIFWKTIKRLNGQWNFETSGLPAVSSYYNPHIYTENHDKDPQT